ncbi:MAG: excinuclease ABC subunit UvrB [Bacteroidetes bacterium]|nr:excinuclease ABC subunit UvrB [Bacteroidota bacterium]
MSQEGRPYNHGGKVLKDLSVDGVEGRPFELVSPFQPTGDQPGAIEALANGLNQGERYQTLLGVTGSGKTFTVANVIESVQRPTLVLSHNKTLAAQLYQEFKAFFPNNAVEYFVSYYDYYQPEAYMPTSGTYIEKDLSINEEIEKLRLSTTSSLLSGRRDVIVIASVSCLYGMGNPESFTAQVVEIKKGQSISRQALLHQLVQALYSRTAEDLGRGSFRVKGDIVDVFPAYGDSFFRIMFWGDEIESIEQWDPDAMQCLGVLDSLRVFPANLFVTTPQQLKDAIKLIELDLGKQVDHFKGMGRGLEAKRIEERTTFDLEMIRELGYCSGIENYSRYLDGRQEGTRPFCLMDYFPEDFLMVVDESHVTLPQVRAMYGGDRSRKENLVEYGFRLPAAMDNRPLTFDEYENLQKQVIYVSATPADHELERSDGVIVEQLIRPTGLLDPRIEVRPLSIQVDDLMAEAVKRAAKDERGLVTTLTKRMAEELTTFLTRHGIRCRYIHSDVETLERVKIMDDLRAGLYDVLIGVNLLREGLDFPEVSLVAIMDADKEGFLRSERALVQTIGRAARNTEGMAIFYADKITNSMEKTMTETLRRRETQHAYNHEHGITPRAIKRNNNIAFGMVAKEDQSSTKSMHLAAEDNPSLYTKGQLEAQIRAARKNMEKAATALDFISAAQFRDRIVALEGYREK